MSEKLHFTVDAALIDRLGRELVGKQETALIELVKNGYDADATKVTVTFDGTQIIVEDDGSGMSRQELEDGFLRLASDLKVRKPVSDRFHRQRAGRKGIGRFATQRLGGRLVLRTWKDAWQPGLELTVDWSTFERGVALLDIPVTLTAIPPGQPGTRIQIDELRDSWSVSQVRRCWRGVLTLQQPFPVAPIARSPGEDPGFQVAFYRSSELFSDSAVIADLQTEVLSQMHAVVEFRVDPLGKAEWRITGNKFGADVDWTPINHEHLNERTPPAYEHVKAAWMKAYYAIVDPREFSQLTFARIRDLLTSEGGIRLYRNGFRVVPYGYPDNDWLRLDQTYARRSYLFPIANRNWFGVIEVRDPEGRIFQEHTSREGLIETPAFQELVALASSVLITAAQKIAEQRNRKVRAGGSGSEEQAELLLRRLRDAKRKASEAVSANAKQPVGEVNTSPTGVAAMLGEAEHIIEDVKAHFADEAAMLRFLATLGLTAAEFSHETGMTFQAVRLDFQRIFALALEAHPGADESTTLVSRTRGMVERLDALTSYLNELASARSARQLAPVSVSRSVEQFAAGMRQLAERSETEIAIETPPFDGLYTKPMHRAEVASILLNFYSNSIKAMKQAVGQRRIHVEAKREDEDIVVRFSDTGEGIPEENRQRVFNLFFTTRAAAPAGASPIDESTGTGLGLWIVHQIVSRAQGSVEVVDPKEAYATTLEVRLPASEEEL